MSCLVLMVQVVLCRNCYEKKLFYLLWTLVSTIVEFCQENSCSYIKLFFELKNNKRKKKSFILEQVFISCFFMLKYIQFYTFLNFEVNKKLERIYKLIFRIFIYLMLCCLFKSCLISATPNKIISPNFCIPYHQNRQKKIRIDISIQSFIFKKLKFTGKKKIK